MFSLFQSKKAPLYAAIDVGSHAVKAIIFEKTEDKKNPKILKKMVMKLPPAVESIRMVHKLREILFVLVKELGRVPEKLIIALGPSIATHAFETWRIEPNGGEKISIPELNSLFEKISTAHGTDGRTIFAYPVEFLINGYTVARYQVGAWNNSRMGMDSRRKRDETLSVSPGSSINFRTLALSCVEDIGTGLVNLKRSFGGLPIEFLPLAVAHQYVATNIFGHRDAVLIDIGGETTVLTAIQDAAIGGIVSFEVGGRSFLRGIARAAGVSFDEAEDLKRQYASDHISAERKQLVSSFIAQETDFWKKKFVEALNVFYRLGPLPPDVLLFGGGSNLEDISSYLREGSWLQDFSYAPTANVKFLQGSDLFEGSTLKGFLQGREEFALGSLIHYALAEK